MVPTGRADGSLQVLAVSPLRAAGLPLMFTSELPVMIVPLLLGGLTNVPPMGRWGGVFVAVLFWVPAGLPIMLTLVLGPPSIRPVKLCGVSTVGAVPGG